VSLDYNESCALYATLSTTPATSDQSAVGAEKRASLLLNGKSSRPGYQEQVASVFLLQTEAARP
jgi:hypothetical protein